MGPGLVITMLLMYDFFCKQHFYRNFGFVKHLKMNYFEYFLRKSKKQSSKINILRTFVKTLSHSIYSTPYQRPSPVSLILQYKVESVMPRGHLPLARLRFLNFIILQWFQQSSLFESQFYLIKYLIYLDTSREAPSALSLGSGVCHGLRIKTSTPCPE